MAALLEQFDFEIPHDSLALMQPTQPQQPRCRRWVRPEVKLVLCAAVLYGLGYALRPGSLVPPFVHLGSAKHITGLASKAADDASPALLVGVAALKTEVKSLEAHQQAPAVSPQHDATTSNSRDVNGTNEGPLPLGSNKKRPFCVDTNEKQAQLVKREIELEQGRYQALNGTGFNVTLAAAQCNAKVSYLKARLLATEAGPVPGGNLLVAIVVVVAGSALMTAVATSVLTLILDRGFLVILRWASSAPFWPAKGKSVEVKGQAAVTLLMPLGFLGLGGLMSSFFGAAAGSSPLLLGVGALLIYRTMHLETVYAQELEAEYLRRLPTLMSLELMSEEEKQALTKGVTEEDEGALPKTIWGFVLRDLKGLRKRQAPNFFLSKLEVLDAQSDGLTTAAAFFLDVSAKARFCASFSSNGPVVHTVVSALGLPGLMFFFLLVAVITQCGALVVCGDISGGGKDDKVPCEFAGFSIRPSKCVTHADIERATLSALARTLCEGIPQILLQGSMLMAVGQSLLQQPLLMISLVLSLFTSCRKAHEVTRNIALLSEYGMGFFFSLLTGSAAALWLLLLLAIWRTVMLQLCPCHVWGITSGCQVLL